MVTESDKEKSRQRDGVHSRRVWIVSKMHSLDSFCSKYKYLVVISYYITEVLFCCDFPIRKE